MSKMNVALYARVSTNEQFNENQKHKLIKKAELEEWDYQYIEEKESTRKTRPIKNQIYQDALKGKWDGICIYRLDRWGRSLSELTMEIETLVRRKVNFVSLCDSIDLSTAVGKLQFQIICAFAEFERNLISERTKEGQERARREGKKIGRPKGSKDKKVRRKSGYHLRWSKKK